MNGFNLNFTNSTIPSNIPTMANTQAVQSGGMFNNLSNMGSNLWNGLTNPETQQLLFGNKDQMGLLQGGAGILQGLSGLYGGYQTYQLGKDQLNFQKDAFNKNYQNQVQLTNLALRDRQERRYRNRPDLYQNPDEYMSKNQIK